MEKNNEVNEDNSKKKTLAKSSSRQNIKDKNKGKSNNKKVKLGKSQILQKRNSNENLSSISKQINIFEEKNKHFSKTIDQKEKKSPSIKIKFKTENQKNKSIKFKILYKNPQNIVNYLIIHIKIKRK